LHVLLTARLPLALAAARAARRRSRARLRAWAHACMRRRRAAKELALEREFQLYQLFEGAATSSRPPRGHRRAAADATDLTPLPRPRPKCTYKRGGVSNVTLLMCAARYDHERVAELLLRHDEEVNLQDSGDSTALMHAASQGHERVVDLLIRHGAEINLQSSASATPH